MKTRDVKFERDRDREEIVKTFIATWNKHDANATNKLLDADVVFQSPLFSSPVRGIAEYATDDEKFLTSIPDLELRFSRSPLMAISSRRSSLALDVYRPGQDSRSRPHPSDRSSCGIRACRVFPDDSRRPDHRGTHYYHRLGFLQQLNPAY
jgi:hypothetical protein